MAPPLKSQPSRLIGGLALGLGLAGSLAIASPVRAVTAVPTIYGTGVTASGQTGPKPSGSTNGTDVNWRIVQYPTNAGSPPAAAEVPVNVPNTWIGAVPGQSDDNYGSEIDGVTYRWISASTAINAVSTGVPGNNVDPISLKGDYNYILQQNFNVATSGTYRLSLNLIGDNQAWFYINGSIVGGNTATPTISGGSLIGSADTTLGSLSRNYFISNSATLNAGTNTAYLVVKDLGLFTGVLTSNVTFTQDAPGPLPLLGVGAAFGWSRRLRRRINSGAMKQEASS